MTETGKKAILTVSFGTAYASTREKTLDAIESDFRRAFPDYRHYSAWSSRILAAREGRLLVKQSCEQLLSDGITQLYVQPTHLMRAIEYERVQSDLEPFRDKLSVQLGQPLLSCREDVGWSARFLHTVYRADIALGDGECLLLMGHGTSHAENAVFLRLRQELAALGCHDILLGTVEGAEGLAELLPALEATGMKRVKLAPFMIVAGNHAYEDLCGAAEDSWRSQLRQRGYSVSENLKGLGEYPEIRAHFTEKLCVLLSPRP